LVVARGGVHRMMVWTEVIIVSLDGSHWHK
jgi:hypothetical protein